MAVRRHACGTMPGLAPAARSLQGQGPRLVAAGAPRASAGRWSQPGIRCSRSGQGGWPAARSGTAPREPKATGATFQTGANMIIVSESSAEAAQPERTDRYTPACRRSSAARNDTPRYADVRSISVHTEEVTGSIPVSPTLKAPGQRSVWKRSSRFVPNTCPMVFTGRHR